jgi:hypothetical protein
MHWEKDMAAGFVTIPDWFSFENQGANVAVADVDGDGHPDVVVLMVDHPIPGPNRGFYRVGRKLDTTGDVIGGWGPWMTVPDWFSFENQGAGVAVADLGGIGSGSGGRVETCEGAAADLTRYVIGTIRWRDRPTNCPPCTER